MSRKVIVNVDDLGLAEPINNAVVQLAKNRLITASSYMVGGHISDTSIKALQLYNIDIGLHLDFTGVFDTALPKSVSRLLKASCLRRLETKTVIGEIKQQIDNFEDTFNHAPRFIDGHQHVHQFATIRECLINELLSRYGKNNHNNTTFSKNSNTAKLKTINIAARVTTPINANLKGWIIYALGGYQWKKLCEQSGIATNSHFGGVYDFKASTDKLTKLWDGWLHHCPLGIGGFNKQIQDNPISVIMCHPAIADDHWHDEIKQAREREYQWMMSGELKQLYSKHFIELTHWREI